MSNLIHCDGPGCDKSFDPDGPEMSRLCEEPWIRVRSDGLPRLDFHAQACLAAWSSGKPRTSPADDQPCMCAPTATHTRRQHNSTIPAGDQPCMCNGSQVDPHTKAEHQAYPTTTVDGL